MNLIDFFASPAAYAFGWTLLHAIWQGFALVLPVAVMLHLLRHQASFLRYRLGVLTLLAQLVASVSTFMWYYKPSSADISTHLETIVTRSAPVRWQVVVHTLSWPEQVQQFLNAHLSQFVMAYLVGIVLFGLRLAGGWLYLQQLSRTATRPDVPIWSDLTQKLQSSLGLRTVIQIRESARIAVPMVIGVLKPVLLLPFGLAATLSIREIEVILAHELAHIKRHDYAVNLLQSVVEVLYFFHPALWWLSARVREEREHCCDDLAVQACGGDGHLLARALAHVEELRLTQTYQTPVLAVAFASKRQQLLHRVRRALGVPTRSFVSNAHLAGLTLATLLLLSASVYAIQKQDDNQQTIRQSKPTRRHKAGNGTEFSVIDNRKVEYIIWKGKKLPKARVARLQSQLDQVMAGQLSLDAVPQADRNILLTIIETNNGFNNGMEGLAKGLAQIDYGNIVVAALDDTPLIPDETVAGLARVDYSNIIQDAMASVSIPKVAFDSLTPQQVNNQRKMDSLSSLLTQRSQQIQILQLQMEKMRFPVEESERNRDVLDWRKDKLMDQRNALLEKHQQLLNNEGKQKLSQSEVEKQLQALEPEIKKQEISIEELNKQLEAAQAKIESAQQPLEKLEQETEQLEEQLEKLSEQLGQYSNEFVKSIPRIAGAPKVRFMNGSVRPARPSRRLGPAKAPNVLRGLKSQLTPVVPAAPSIHAAPAVPVVPAHPAHKPKLATTPKPDKAQSSTQSIKFNPNLLGFLVGNDKC